MANTLGGLSLSVVANEALAALMAKAPLLSVFTTDFSADIAAAGASVQTRVVTPFTTANDTHANGYSGQAAVSTAKTVTLVQRDVSVAFTDLEVSTMTLPKLQNTFIKPVTQGLIETVVQSGMGLLVTGTYTGNVMTSGALWASHSAADLAKNLSTARVDTNDRALVLNPTYFNYLAKDTAVSAAYAFGGTEAIREHIVPRVHGFNVFEYASMPANGQNVVGAAIHKSALALAARQPAVPANFPGEVASATDPDSGLTIQVRSWYDATAGKTYLAATLIYGIAVGEVLGAAIIKSA